MISAAKWAEYRTLVNKIGTEDFNNDTLTWRRASATTVPEFFEDDILNVKTDIALKVLIGYNYFRTWPMTEDTLHGAQDEQNMVVHINKDYLSGLGYLSAAGYFDFKPEDDVFIHRGIVYRSFGDTFHSQAMDDPMFIQLILKRDIIATGTDRHAQP